MSDRIKILGIEIDRVDMKEALEKVDYILQKGKGPEMVVTPNPEIIVMSLQDSELAAIINQAALRIPDGSGVVFASRLLKKGIFERVTGFDLMNGIFKLAEKEDYSIYLLGSEPGVAVTVSKKLRKSYPDLDICGYHHGYLGSQEEKEQLIEEINELKPDILFVGMGVPRQEKFLGENLHLLKIGLAMCVGGSFDVIAGRVKRAPLWMQELNLEWLFRLLQQPGRAGRMLALPKFALLVLKECLKKGVSR
ncbi:MAG TPA: WecB/TagA/CpsF family glycosyltransferase [Halanaerobiales bacterium]|nr:WecB/TagA/CpsF family glycosyltransferase [Halanaerobiales bacterium]